METACREMLSYISTLKVMNTHSHHGEDVFFEDFDLNKILNTSYVKWCGQSFDDTAEARRAYLKMVRYKSFFRALQKGLMKLYSMEEELTAENWDEYNDRIVQHYQDKNWHLKVLERDCNYEKIILDAYWNPGNDNKHPRLFAPAFRIDSLLFGFDRDVVDHDGNNAYRLFGQEAADIDEYMEFVHKLLLEQIKKGSVCIKNAIAYDRDIRYENVSRGQANKAFCKRRTREDIRNFQDYVFDEICGIAGELQIPVQCHTGMGCGDGTRAIQMLDLIRRHPKTKFSLMHGSFPWCSDILAYLDKYPNVFVDIVWLPTLSPTTACYTIKQLIEAGTSNRIVWGCDTWNSEASLGARLTANETVARALADLIECHYFNEKDARDMARYIFYDNAKALFAL